MSRKEASKEAHHKATPDGTKPIVLSSGAHEVSKSTVNHDVNADSMQDKVNGRKLIQVELQIASCVAPRRSAIGSVHDQNCEEWTYSMTVSMSNPALLRHPSGSSPKHQAQGRSQ